MDSVNAVEEQQVNSAQPVLEQQVNDQQEELQQANNEPVNLTDVKAKENAAQDQDADVPVKKTKKSQKSQKLTNASSRNSKVSTTYPIRGRPIHNPINNENHYSPNKEFVKKAPQTFSFGKAYDRIHHKQTLRDNKQEHQSGPGTYTPHKNYTNHKDPQYTWSKDPKVRFEFRKLQGADQIQYTSHERQFSKDASQGLILKSAKLQFKDNAVPGSGTYSPNKEAVKTQAPAYKIRMDHVDTMCQRLNDQSGISGIQMNSAKRGSKTQRNAPTPNYMKSTKNAKKTAEMIR